MSLHLIQVRDTGPGAAFLAEHKVRSIIAASAVGADQVVRVHVPARGQGTGGEGAVRGELEPMIGPLQTVSLFGDTQCVVIHDAHQLLTSEADLLADLIGGVDPEAVVAIVVASGRLPAVVAKALKAAGAAEDEVKAVRERDAADWLAGEVRRRKLGIDAAGRDALLATFGTDLAALAGALDQLASGEGELDAASLAKRFRNRPEEPIWLYLDAVLAGDVQLALRRLEDFLTHGHPLQLLSFMEGDARRRAIASEEASPAAYAERVGKPVGWQTRRDHERASALGESGMAAELAAIAKAEKILKSAPEPMHQVTMERLTVALAGRSARRANRRGGR